MPKSAIWVVKLGGSMLHAPELRAWLAACAGDAPVTCVVVLGGGPLVDEIRALQSSWQYDDALAHELALEAMGLNARAVAAVEPALAPLHWPGRPPTGSALWLPRAPWAWLELPASWAVTSDSVALRLAQCLDAAAVVLVKSVPAARLVAASAAAHAAAGTVDGALPDLLARNGIAVHLAAREHHASLRAGRATGRLPGVAIG